MLGVIADDLTGATDAACIIARRGLSVVQVNGVPAELIEPGPEAIVVALKTRTLAPADAVAQSLIALDWLQKSGASQIYFKYCSTFDSTPSGNIGPVAKALALQLGAGTVVFCPSFPENGRTVYLGHLFVGDRLISESSLARHPLTPMTDPDLVRFLGLQVKDRQVVNLPFACVDAGADEVKDALVRLNQQGGAFVVADSLTDQHIDTLGKALESAPLVSGGSPLCGSIARAHSRSAGRPGARIAPAASDGPIAILAGSCSDATRRQLQRIETVHPVIRLDPACLADDKSYQDRLAEAAINQLSSGVAVIASSAEPNSVKETQDRLGTANAGTMIEQALGDMARRLSDAGVRVFVVAGGETSSAVASALGITRLTIGPEITPGVPWTQSLSSPHYRMAFKSGNFGGPDFFLDALRTVEIAA